MRLFARRLLGVILDLRVIVGICGVLLSIAMHELFHILIHWRDIRSISLFPDGSAIMELIFVPSGDYDLVFEEAVAYTITMIVLLLTVMLICDIHDARDSKSVGQTILAKDLNSDRIDMDDQALDHLSALLGIAPAAH